jgi:apolipoprotein N-acyltransferase
MPASDGPVPSRPHRAVVTAGLAAAHAVLFAASYPKPGLWPLAFVAPLPLLWLAVGAASTRRALAAVAAAQLLMWLWLYRWVIDVTGLGYPALAVYMTAYPVAFTWLLRRVALHPRTSHWPLAIVAPLLWVGLECLRGSLLFHGYAWFLAGHPLIEWPLLVQSADLLGVYFVSFLVVMTAALVVDGVRRRIAWRWVVPAVVLLHVANGGYGWWRLAQTAPLRPGPVPLAIQTNLPQSNKVVWEPRQQVEDVAGFIVQTETAWASAREAGVHPDFVIWPETMLPGFGLEPDAIRTLLEGNYFPGDEFSRAVADLAERLGVPLLVGSPSFVGLRVVDGRAAWEAHYNSAYLVTGRPPYQRYDKVFLTPFGETMPYISAWPWLEQRLLALGAAGMRFDLDAAGEIRRIRLNDSITLATPICFEDTVAPLCRRMIRGGANVLVSLSNDGWFGDDDGGRIQHAQIARFRCIENRVPMIRAVNTGMTVAIDSAGRLIGGAGPGRYGTARRPSALRAELPLDSRSTVYGRVGDLWGWLCLAGSAGLVAWVTLVRRSESGTCTPSS